MSETTILTAQMVKVDLYTHIRSQAWSSLPAFGLACVVFMILGIAGPAVTATPGEEVELAKLDQIYWISPVNLIPLLVLVVMSARKVPASLALLSAALVAGVLAPFTQASLVREFVGDIGGSPNVVVGAMQAIWKVMANGLTVNTGIADIDRLVSRGGMDSMLFTIWLIIGAVTFGALLEHFGLINRLIVPAIAAARTRGRLYLTVFATAFGLNLVAGDQYIALVLPSRIYRAEFGRRGLAPQNLSRLCADSATVTSPLVPWNSCGAFMGAVLGVATLSYLPFALFCIFSRCSASCTASPDSRSSTSHHRNGDLGVSQNATGEHAGSEQAGKVNLPTLTAMVVGSMVGSGVFLLPRRFGTETGVFGAIIAWAIAGTGMLMLAFCFQRLATRKPDLDAGIYAYAKAGFGDYVGFASAFGFWASACAGNCSYWVLIMTTTSALFPGLGDGTTVAAVIVSSVCVWLFFLLISRGVQQAAIINRIATIAKIIPLVVFIVLALVMFDAGYFADNFWGGNGIDVGSLWDQVTGTMLITVFVFLGIEGASVYSRFARKREDVGKATVFGFLGVLGVFALVTLVSYGSMPQGELASIDQRRWPRCSRIWSVTGVRSSFASASWCRCSALPRVDLMAAEILFIPARSKDMPAFLGRENKAGAPIWLWFSPRDSCRSC